MSSYTMQLRDIIEDLTHGEAFNNQREQIEIGRKKLFDFDYEVFDKNYKNVFETHFIRNFYMREIGFETDGLFRFQMESWLLVNMPYFNKMFESELIEYDPLINSKVDVTHKKENDRLQNDLTNLTKQEDKDGTSITDSVNRSNTDGTTTSDAVQKSDAETTTDKDTTGKVTTDDFKRTLDSNNPDSRLAIAATDGQGVIEYASKINEENENNKSDSTGSEKATGTSTATDTTAADTTASSQTDTTQKDSNVTTDKLQADHEKTNETKIKDLEDFIEHRTGKIGSTTYASMVKEYRQTLLRIERQIFDEMQELFMLVY